MIEMTDAQRTTAMQSLTTEHTALQTARSATIYEANGRATLFLSSLASAVVALAFVGQISGIGATFYLFGLVLFAVLGFLGIATFYRLLQSGIEDVLYARAINRIRQYYVEQNPHITPYLLLSTDDDDQAAMKNMGITPSPWQILLTAAGTVGVITSVLAGAFVGVGLAWLAGLPLLPTVGASLLATLIGGWWSYRVQVAEWRRVEQQLPVHKTRTPQS